MSIKTYLTVCGRPAAFIVGRTYGWKDAVDAAPPHADAMPRHAASVVHADWTDLSQQ